MDDKDFSLQERRVAEWLYHRIMIEREEFYREKDVDVPAWPQLRAQAVRNTYLKEARELIGVAAGNSTTGNRPQQVWEG